MADTIRITARPQLPQRPKAVAPVVAAREGNHIAAPAEHDAELHGLITGLTPAQRAVMVDVALADRQRGQVQEGLGCPGREPAG